MPLVPIAVGGLKLETMAGGGAARLTACSPGVQTEEEDLR